MEDFGGFHCSGGIDDGVASKGKDVNKSRREGKGCGRKLGDHKG